MAIRSHLLVSAAFRISAGGSPNARCRLTEIPSELIFAAVDCRYERSARISSDSASFNLLKFRATQPSATWTSSRWDWKRRANAVTCGNRLLSAELFSSATRIFWYITQTQLSNESHDPLRDATKIEQVFYVQYDNNGGGKPGEHPHTHPRDATAPF